MAGRTKHDVDQLQMQRVIFYGQNFNGVLQLFVRTLFLPALQQLGDLGG